MGEEFGLSRLDCGSVPGIGDLCDYLVVLVEDPMSITVPIVSCDITTCDDDEQSVLFWMTYLFT